MDISHFDQYQNLTAKELQMMLWHTIEDVAHNGTTMHVSRKTEIHLFKICLYYGSSSRSSNFFKLFFIFELTVFFLE